MEYTYISDKYGVDSIEAPYALLVEAFGDDGDNPRDRHKSEAQWDYDRGGDVFYEVYDYKQGKSYNGADGLDRDQITEWNVQATEQGRTLLIALLDAAVERLNGKPELSGTVDELKADLPDYADEIAELGDEAEVAIGELDGFQYFKAGGVSITLEDGVRVHVGGLDEEWGGGEVSAPLSDDDVRKAVALLTAYLALKEEKA